MKAKRNRDASVWSSFSTLSRNFDIFDTVPSIPLAFCRDFNALQPTHVWHLPCVPPWPKSMFRISTIDTQGERRLVVEGTLVQPWVTELRRTWSDAGNSLDGRKLVIDLTNATMIDLEGKAVILDLMKEGAKFCCGDVLTKHVLKQLAHKCHTRLRNVLNRPDSNGGRCWEREKK